jgi:hypothetical protein
MGDIVVSLHGHDIVKLHGDGSVSFTMAGWPTVTTKDRVNAFLPGGFRVFHENGTLYVRKRAQCDRSWSAVPIADNVWRYIPAE